MSARTNTPDDDGTSGDTPESSSSEPSQDVLRNNAGGKPAIVKKYANRRLYNTATSSYVTLDELSRMVRGGQEFLVYDAKTGDDITRSVLTQIILEEDAKGRNLLPISFLRQVIRFYDDSLHAFVPRYLELSMENFAKNQDQIRGYVEETFGRFFPINQFEDMARQNVAMMQRATRMFSPFGEDKSEEGTEDRAVPQSELAKDQDSRALDDEVANLKRQMELLQNQLHRLDVRTNAKTQDGNNE